jgi:hypothetical protein
MKIKHLIYLFGIMLSVALYSPALAINNLYSPAITNANVQYYLEHPNMAAAATYQLHDSAGNEMDVPSIIQMTGQSYKYAAVYHTPVCVSGCTPPATAQYRYQVNLAASNDLVTWTYIGLLVDNASMPKIAQISGASWVVVTHEQWLGSGTPSAAPAQVGYELFYDFNDLMSKTIRSTWIAPQYIDNLNGTPSVYEFHLANYGGYYSVDGQYGFHFNDTSTGFDENAVTTITQLFDPTGGTATYPSTASTYNGVLQSAGAVATVGDRDTLVTTTARFNVQEGNVGAGANFWYNWRIFLYTFVESTNYPTGAGSAIQLSPVTPNSSTSLGNPTISVVDNPSGTGKALVVSYFIFGQGAGSGEAGSLLYYFNI